MNINELAALNDTLETLRAERDTLRAALARLATGVAGEGIDGCDWYEGITDDAMEEARAALAVRS